MMKIMRLTIVISIIACFVLGLGCSSAQKDESAPWIAVVIQGNTPGQIRNMTETVFRENGYLVTRTGPNNLVFEKRAGKLSNLAYGSWLDDEPVWERAKVAIVPVAEMTFRLECNARLITDRGGPIEEETKMRGLRRGPYEAILKEVVRRFQSKTGRD